jgi:hypothetical protein
MISLRTAYHFKGKIHLSAREGKPYEYLINGVSAVRYKVPFRTIDIEFFHEQGHLPDRRTLERRPIITPVPV